MAGLDFESGAPDAAPLSRQWHAALDAARAVVRLLPGEQVGRAVLTKAGDLFRGAPNHLSRTLSSDELTYHEGRICGAFPHVINQPKK